MPMPRAKSLFPIGTPVAKVLARSAARNAVKQQLQAQGVRVSHVPHAEIVARASAYLSDHPELYAEALERAQRLGMIEPELPVSPHQVARKRALILLKKKVQLLRFSEVGAY
jgi:hypothetical protein